MYLTRRCGFSLSTTHLPAYGAPTVWGSKKPWKYGRSIPPPCLPTHLHTAARLRPSHRLFSLPVAKAGNYRTYVPAWRCALFQNIISHLSPLTCHPPPCSSNQVLASFRRGWVRLTWPLPLPLPFHSFFLHKVHIPLDTRPPPKQYQPPPFTTIDSLPP